MKRSYSALLLALAVLLISADNAYAYLDPGTSSMILQGLIGGIAGGLFAIRVYWGKLKSRFRRTPSTVHTSPAQTNRDAPDEKAR
jgi:hypothetical protein